MSLRPGVPQPGFVFSLLAGLAVCLPGASPVFADQGDAPAREASSPGAPGQIGIVYDTLRRSRQQTSIFQTLSGDYADFRERMEEDYGLIWSFSLSYRQRWVQPDSIGTSSQVLFWPSLNWNLFESESLGAGSLQYLYFGERRSGARVTGQVAGRSYSGTLPDYQNRFAQLTYTHTLPGERLSVAIGQYSFFSFDSSEYMADQQLNFVNSMFSENGSSTYPVAGVGAYVQFNASDTVQFLAGGQNAHEEDSSRPSLKGFGRRPYAWLGYAQWTPRFDGLGEAQYSLTLYQSPANADQAASSGWSINGVQHLGGRWAVFGRANGSSDDAGGSRHTHGAGVALNNPVGRNEADQIGLAVGRSEQRRPLVFGAVGHTQSVLETYWNWSIADGVMLTPDAQYIRNPLFAPGRDSAWILSLRTTLVF